MATHARGRTVFGLPNGSTASASLRGSSHPSCAALLSPVSRPFWRGARLRRALASGRPSHATSSRPTVDGSASALPGSQSHLGRHGLVDAAVVCAGPWTSPPGPGGCPFPSGNAALERSHFPVVAPGVLVPSPRSPQPDPPRSRGSWDSSPSRPAPS